MRALVVVGAALVLCLNASAAAPTDTSWTTYGDGLARAGDAAGATPTDLTRDFVLPLDGRIVGQVLADGEIGRAHV